MERRSTPPRLRPAIEANPLISSAVWTVRPCAGLACTKLMAMMFGGT
jgi:hypothetical protein